MPSVDDLKLARDGHLWHGPKVEPRPQFVVSEERDPVTGHTFRGIAGMGAIEYAPPDCECPECVSRRNPAVEDD